MKKRLIIPVLLAAGLLFTTAGICQQVVKVDQNFTIQLTDQLLQQKSITLDISALQFKDEANAVKFFNSIKNNLVEFSLDYSTKTATMNLFPERLGTHEWTLANWNEYISGMGQRCTTTYNSFLNQ